MKNYLILIFIFCSTSVGATKYPIETHNEFIKRLLLQSDVIFVGQIIEKKIIKDGFIVEQNIIKSHFENNILVEQKPVIEKDSGDIGIWSVKIKKVYRGKLKVGDIRTVCSRIIYPSNKASVTEMIYTIDKNEYTIFGIQNGKHIYPAFHMGYLMDPIGNENIILKWLKHYKKTNHKKYSVNYLVDIFGSSENGRFIRNACLENL